MGLEQQVQQFTVDRPAKERAWFFCDPMKKLILRGKLPGAAGYDETIRLFRRLQSDGVPALDLLPAALPNSWMVNSRAPSSTFQYWMTENFKETWASLLALLDKASDGLGALTESEQNRMQTCVSSLCIRENGIADLSKVLSLLKPDVVPLMDDAAIHFATGLVQRPESANKNSSPSRAFLPMLRWFEEATRQAKEELDALASAYPLGDLGAAQVLDRLLWFDSWGFHLFRTKPEWVWIQDADRAAVVLEEAPAATLRAAPRDPVDLGEAPVSDWSQRCLAKLASLP